MNARPDDRLPSEQQVEEFSRDGAIVLGGFLLMLWLPHVSLPPVLARAAGVLAGASLFIYLTHWQVYPALEDAGHQWLALVASLTVGIAYARVVRPVHQAVGRAVLASR